MNMDAPFEVRRRRSMIGVTVKRCNLSQFVRRPDAIADMAGNESFDNDAGDGRCAAARPVY